jgi:hypothetical protein
VEITSIGTPAICLDPGEVAHAHSIRQAIACRVTPTVGSFQPGSSS